MDALQYFDQIRDVMIRSGKLVMQHFRSDFALFEKNNHGILTSVDIENEQLLLVELAKIVPHAGFLAEESGISGMQSDWMWVIDALDGTRNFAKGIPHFCIMVALTYRNVPVMSAIYQPVTQELYYAEAGKGTWLQDNTGMRRIRFVDSLYKTKTAIVVCGQKEWPTIKAQCRKNGVNVSRRYFGSAGLDSIYLLHGYIDLLVINNSNWWDVVPGMLLTTEACGLEYRYETLQEHKYQGNLYAGNSLFFKEK